MPSASRSRGTSASPRTSVRAASPAARLCSITDSNALRRSASVAPSLFGGVLCVGAQDRADRDDRRARASAAHDREKCAQPSGEQLGAVGRARPAVRAMRDRDRVRGQLRNFLGARDLAASRACVAEVHDVEPMFARGDVRPLASGLARAPALGDRIAITKPARIARRGRDRASQCAEREHARAHAFGQVDDGAPRARASSERDAPFAELRLCLAYTRAIAKQPERRARARAAIAKLARLGANRDLHRFARARELEPHADGQRRARACVRRQPQPERARIAARIRRAFTRLPRATA